MTRRRARRIGVIVTILVVAVIAGGVIRVVVRRITAVPAPVIDYATQIEQLAAAHAAEGTDGWPALVLAMDRFAVAEAAAAATPPAELYGTTPPNDTQLAGHLDAAGVPEALAAVATADRFVRPIDRTASPWFTQFSIAGRQIRSLARARATCARSAFERGDPAAAVEALEQVLAVARACAGQATVMDRLLAGAVAQMALGKTRALARTHGLDAATADAISDAMDRQVAWPPLSMVLEGERLALHAVIQASFTDDGHGDGRFSPDLAAGVFGGTPSASPVDGISGMFLARRAETRAVVDAYVDAVREDAALSPPDRTFDSDRFMSDYGRRYVLVKALLPAIAHVGRLDDRQKLEVAATRTVIAIERYRATRGALPTDLADLGPEPAIDPLHGGSLVYRLDPGATGGYVLYSTGYDAVDDSASLPAVIEGPATKAGTDVLLTRELES